MDEQTELKELRFKVAALELQKALLEVNEEYGIRHLNLYKKYNRIYFWLAVSLAVIMLINSIFNVKGCY